MVVLLCGSGESYENVCKAANSKWREESSVWQAREVNPVDYDRKVKFWTSLISSSSRAERSAIFTVDGLKRRLEYSNQVETVTRLSRSYGLVSKNFETLKTKFRNIKTEPLQVPARQSGASVHRPGSAVPAGVCRISVIIRLEKI